jgi:hypothetical protein
MKVTLPALLALALVSCGQQYPRKISYELGESYPVAKARISAHYEPQKSSFSLFHDRTDVSSFEIRPGAESTYSLAKWGPDIGRHSAHRARLKKNGNGSTFEVVELPPSKRIDASVGWMLGDKIGWLDKIDKWVTGNLQVKSRVVGEDRSNGSFFEIRQREIRSGAY